MGRFRKYFAHFVQNAEGASAFEGFHTKFEPRLHRFYAMRVFLMKKFDSFHKIVK